MLIRFKLSKLKTNLDETFFESLSSFTRSMKVILKNKNFRIILPAYCGIRTSAYIYMVLAGRFIRNGYPQKETKNNNEWYVLSMATPLYDVP